jgi:integrase
MYELTTHNPFDYTAIDRADLAPSTRIKYKAAIAAILLAGVDPMNYIALQDYAQSLPTSGRSFLKAALKVITSEYVNQVKASATPDNIHAIQAFLYRIEAMNEAIPVHQPKGKKMHTWLSQEQVDEITSIALSESFRDYIILACLLGAGLRREEMSELTFDALRRVPVNGTIKDVLEVTGKGDTNRVILISPLLAQRLREWQAIVGPGRVARSINKSGVMGDSLSDIGIFRIVRKYGDLIGLPALDPHDCRRSYGRIVYEQTHDIKLVRDLLGHASPETTMRYIGLDLNLDVDATNFVIRPFEGLQVSGD